MVSSKGETAITQKTTIVNWEFLDYFMFDHL